MDFRRLGFAAESEIVNGPLRVAQGTLLQSFGVLPDGLERDDQPRKTALVTKHVVVLSKISPYIEYAVDPVQCEQISQVPR